MPCYTEGEESLRACIESLTRLKYDDKRKLIFIVVDGMVVGSGNDKPTSEIVLDILGVTDRFKQEPLSFLSIGEGAKQHNMGKVFSGLFEASGHIVPFVVRVAIRTSARRTADSRCSGRCQVRKGDRKAATWKPRQTRLANAHDALSQSRALRRANVAFGARAFPPHEEHHWRSSVLLRGALSLALSLATIKIDKLEQYILQVDADTTVDPYGLNYLVSACVEDKRSEHRTYWHCTF